MATLQNVEPGRLANIEYGRVGDISLRMDAQIPPSPRPLPAVVLVHGGGWIGGHRTYNVAPLFEPLFKAGFAWFSISYRLATDFYNFGAAVDDVRAAVRHIRENAAAYNIEPKRIALAGESAGAHLASMAALCEPRSVAAVVALYGPSDLERMAMTSTAIPPQIRDALAGSAFRSMLINHLRSLSPIHQVKAGAPPFLLMHGTADHIVPFEQSVRMCEKLVSAGGDCQLEPVRGGAHGMRFWDSSPDQAAYRQRLVAWLMKRLSV